jgi:Holliday junction resolvase-like predicted endonuclease
MREPRNYDKHKGAQAELVACAWLLEHGYETFRNVSPYGPVDIVAIKGDKIHRFDVKSGATASLKKHQKDAGILILHVNCRTKIVCISETSKYPARTKVKRLDEHTLDEMKIQERIKLNSSIDWDDEKYAAQP